MIVEVDEVMVVVEVLYISKTSGCPEGRVVMVVVMVVVVNVMVVVVGVVVFVVVVVVIEVGRVSGCVEVVCLAVSSKC